MQTYQNPSHQYREDDHRISSNCINQEGNNLITGKLLALMVNAVRKIKA
jgi:hypothetical protein